MDPFDQNDTREGSRQKAHGNRIWRWLILDGFTGHFSIEIIDYCLRFDIQLVTLPAHSSHLMQPMDVGVFSHFKNEHQKVLFERVREGDVRFSRLDFVMGLNRIWEAAFTKGHVLTGFEDSGIWPLNAMPVLNKLTGNKAAIDTPRLPEALPSESRHESAKYAAGQITSKYKHLTELMSSPTRRGLKDLATSANEVIVFQQDAQRERRKRDARLKRLANARIQRTVKSSDNQFATPITLNELREREAEKRLEDTRKEMKRQRVAFLKILRKQREGHLQTWRAAGYKHEGQRVTKQKYLDLVGFTDEYIALDTGNKNWHPDPTPLWALDTSRQKVPAGDHVALSSNDSVDIVTQTQAEARPLDPLLDSPLNEDDLLMGSSPPPLPDSPCPGPSNHGGGLLAEREPSLPPLGGH
ncbi:hypothetical protein RB594_006558 [Gaeumannomyces avenae]